MWDLDFINKESLTELVRELYEKYLKRLDQIDLKKFNKNIVDPVRLYLTKEFLGQSWKELIDEEIVRQTDKYLNNLIGEFYQNLFKFLNFCEVPERGFDVIFEPNEKIQNQEFGSVSRVYAELKNKFNTMNSSSSANLHRIMEKQILEDDDSICALVEVISKKSTDEPWAITYDNKNHKHNRIRRMGISRFLTLVTGDRLAFYKLCKVLPEIINDVKKDLGEPSINSTAYEELKKLAQEKNLDIYDILLNMAFGNYEGFDL